MKVAFIVVLYKTPKEEVVRLKREIKGIGFDAYKLYFVDNTKTNRGYAAGVNIGIKKAIIDNCELLIVGNPDISLKNLKAEDFLEASKHFDIWGFAFKQHGKTYYGGFIDPLRLSGWLSRFKPRNRFSNVTWVSGSLMCIKKAVIEKIGLFDESFFMYYEDVDYCLRAKKAGLKVGIDSATVYRHFELTSSNPKRQELLSKARKIFFKKYGDIWQKAYEHIFDKILKLVQDDKKPHTRFFVNFFSLNVSSFLSKLLNFILFIFLLRYLKPQEYGIYSLVWVQASLFSPLVDLGTTSYGIVHLTTEKKEKFLTLLNLRMFSSIIVFIFTVGVSWWMFRQNQLTFGYIFLTAFVIFANMLSGSYLIKNAIDGKSYKSSLISTFFNMLLIFFLIISMILFRSLSLIFIIIFILYNLYSLLNYLLLKKDLKRLTFSIDFFAWKGLVKKSYVFVLIGLFAGVYFKIDVLLLQILKGEREVGIYSAGYKFFEALLFIAASYNIARTPVFAKLANQNIKFLFRSMKKDLVFLFLLGTSIAFLIFFLSPWLLPFFLKGNYLVSIAVLRIVIFALPLILLSSVFLNALYVLKRARVVVYVFLAQAVLNFLLNIFLIPKYSYFASSYITVFSEGSNVILLAFIFYLLFKKSVIKFLL